jgi:hypothetical protein
MFPPFACFFSMNVQCRIARERVRADPLIRRPADTLCYGQDRGTGQISIPMVLERAMPDRAGARPSRADPPIRRPADTFCHGHARGTGQISVPMVLETCNAGPRGSASLPRRPADTPTADTLCYYQDFAVDTASSFAFLTVASRSAGAARVGSTKMLVTSVIPMNPKIPPRVLLCRS